ncbi:MAG: ATP-binding protein [Peptococcaceae bacterium]|nr:ATP-binding protein [Peptococcaceae bacterium]
MYIKRHLEDALQKIEKMFPAVLISGPRQVGKTTLLAEVKREIAYVSLDEPIMLRNALEEAGSFFQQTPPPIVVDEIQYAPGLFPYIKLIADKERKKGQFFLTGSQQFQMMKNVSDSLAGRIGILNLLGLSLREIYSVVFNAPFLPISDYFAKRKQHAAEISYHDVWRIIHKGCMPAMYAEDADWQMFYSSYTRTYIARDVRELTQIGDEIKFLNFMTVVASKTSQVLNFASIARDVGISQPTAERWMSVLRASNLVYLLPPYYNNITKRTIKAPKLYFLDTGLAAYLTRWLTPEVLEKGAMSGAFFETFVIAEIIKSYYNTGITDPPLYYYRDKEGREIDLLLMQDGTLYPIEIKKSANPSKSDITAFGVLDTLSEVTRGTGGVICLYDTLAVLKGDDMIIPLKFI